MENREEVIEIIDQNVNLIEELIDQKISLWNHYVLFSDLWWFGVGLSIIPWIVWSIFSNG